jgi:hypothetical protein
MCWSFCDNWRKKVEMSVKAVYILSERVHRVGMGKEMNGEVD